MPVECGPVAARHFAERARRAGRHCSSLVGQSEPVESMWSLLFPAWGPARDVRRQPLMATDRRPLVDPEPGVRRVRIDELDTLLPACVAMFTEEVGVSPVASDGGALYRARVAELIADGRAFALIEDGRVLFKAEIGSATAQACQVQGVWTDPALRGEGLGTRGTAAVVEYALDSIAPVVSLYVNDYNMQARRAYERVGFATVGSFTSVLF
jgi:predicted GNAT family acetyltransferase